MVGKVVSKTLPFAIATLDIRVRPVATKATATNCVLFKVEGYRIWHAVENLAERADLLAGRTD